MKALVYDAPRSLRFIDRPPPQDSDANAVVAVAAAGVCGSDMHAFFGHDERRPPPLILGHEAAGESGGEKVVVNPLAVCGECDFCRRGRSNLCVRREILSMPPREGAFAEYLAAPRENILSLPPSLSLQQGALAEPLACGHHAAATALRYSHLTAEECTAAILGGGAIGAAAALSLAARGVPKIHIAETNPLRRNALQKIGDFIVVAPEDLPQTDIVIDAVGGASSRKKATATAAAGGVIAHIGLAESEGGADMRRATLREIVICGVYTYTAAEFAETVQWMAAGRLGALDWFETRPLKDGLRAFADLSAGKIAAPKIILIP